MEAYITGLKKGRRGRPDCAGRDRCLHGPAWRKLIPRLKNLSGELSGPGPGRRAGMRCRPKIAEQAKTSRRIGPTDARRHHEYDEVYGPIPRSRPAMERMSAGPCRRWAGDARRGPPVDVDRGLFYDVSKGPLTLVSALVAPAPGANSIPPPGRRSGRFKDRGDRFTVDQDGRYRSPSGGPPDLDVIPGPVGTGSPYYRAFDLVGGQE